MKSVLKSMAFWCSSALTFLPSVACRLTVKISGREQGFFGWSEAFSLIPGLIGIQLRRGFYRSTLEQCHPEHVISFGTVLTSRATHLGQHVFVGRNCVLGSCTIERDVLIASQVSVINGVRQHSFDRMDVPIREQPGVFRHITIGRDTWIGERAVICADVGRHCVVGAGSVVTQPVPDGAIVVGAPARVIRYRNQPQRSIESAATEFRDKFAYSDS